MKKSILGFIAAIVIITMASWGYIGHQAVGIIAENHLTPEAKQAVQILLGGIPLVTSPAGRMRSGMQKRFPNILSMRRLV